MCVLFKDLYTLRVRDWTTLPHLWPAPTSYSVHFISFQRKMHVHGIHNVAVTTSVFGHVVMLKITFLKNFFQSKTPLIKLKRNV